MDYNLSNEALARIIQLESGGNPNAVTGSYSGLLQRKQGGNDLAAGRAEIEANASELSRKLGRPVSDAEAYLAHQQGVGGATSHLSNPDQPAWKSMYNTGEGQQKGQSWAKQAIWGNMTPEMKAIYGNVDNVTSGDFVNEWTRRYAGVAPSQAPSSPPVGAPTPPTAQANANPMGQLSPEVFNAIAQQSGLLAQPKAPALSAPTPPPSPPQAPNPLLNMAQLQQFNRPQWIKLF